MAPGMTRGPGSTTYHWKWRMAPISAGFAGIGIGTEAVPLPGPEPAVVVGIRMSAEMNRAQPGAPRGPRSRGREMLPHVWKEYPTTRTALVPPRARERRTPNAGLPSVLVGSPRARISGVMPPDPGQPLPYNVDPGGMPAKEKARTHPSQ